MVSPDATAFAAATQRKIARRLIPFISFLYLIAYLDRVNLAYASLGMTKELHFSDQVYGVGAGIFFLTYALFEIPGTVLVERWSARKWISRIMVTWGLAATFTGLIHTKDQFYAVRLLLGLAEAGFAPGMMIYISHWFPAAYRGRPLGAFYAAIPIANMVGSAASAVLTNRHWLGWSGWRWILILEGLPAVISGIWVFFYLTDRPEEAKWLTVEEKEWIANEFRKDKRGFYEHQSRSGWRAVFQPQVFLLTAVWFLSLCSTNGLNFWLPKILQRMSGYGPFVTIILSGVPWLAAWPFTLLVAWNSDRTGERRWHTAGCLLLACAGLLLSQATSNIAVGILALTLAAIGLNARQPPFWAVSTSLVAGTASAVVVGMINSLGQIGGFFGPSIFGFLKDRTGTYTAGTFYLVGSALLAACLMLLWKPTKKAAPIEGRDQQMHGSDSNLASATSDA